MYLQTGFGQLSASRSKDKVIYGCINRVLFFPFRQNFTDYRQEVRKALGRYLTFRRDGGAYLDSLLNAEPNFLQYIQDQHNALMMATPPPAEFSETFMPATFHYTPGFKKVTRITFP